MKPKERIPLHNHADNNSGGHIDGGSVISMVGGSGSISGGGDTTIISTGGLPWFIPEDYGAVGDGTTDDTTAMSDTIAALTSAGRGVLYCPNRYKTAGGFTLSVPCTVLGDGMDTLGGTTGVSEILCTSQTAVLFTVTTDTCRFEKIGLVNSYAGNASAGSAIYANSVNDFQKLDLESVMIHGFYDGVDVKVGQAWEHHNIYVRDVVRYGIRVRNTVTPDAGDWSIVGSTFFQNGRACTSAIHIETAGGGKIVNCKINSGGSHHTNGIELAPTSSTSILLIANNSIEGVTGDAIHATIGAGLDYKHIEITNNQAGLFSNNTGKAVSIVATSAGGYLDILIGSNSFITDGTARSAIQLTNCDNVVVMPQVLDGFSATFTATTCTNVHDFTTGGVSTLDALSDVTITSPAADEQLQYIAGVWVNNARRWEPVTFDPGTGPEIVFDSTDVVMTWETY